MSKRLKKNRSNERLARYAEKWKHDVRAVPQKLKPIKPKMIWREDDGVKCQRCGDETPVDRMECLYGNYWLCTRCARFHKVVVPNLGLTNPTNRW
jgi:hypothetical protein